MKKKILYLLLLITSGLVRAQLIVTNTQTPAQLVQNVLVDSSVVPTNIMFNGASGTANVVRDQAAKFSTNFNATNLGLSQGLLLTTGKAIYALGPNNFHNDTNTCQIISPTAAASDPDLALLSGNTIGSCAVLEFDFVATGLELNFDFVFASEEYAGYVNSINDAFGFFLRGPGITGPYAGGAKNIALIPSTNIPITINSVNNGPNNNGTCSNCAYYINNSPTGVNPNTSTVPTVEYDGFTTVLTAKANLQCGQTYHIKLAVGNIADDLLDSAVFLKGFRIKPMELSVSGGLFGNTITLCNGQGATINSGITPGGNTFKWYKDGGLLPSETTPDLAVSSSGVYTLEEYTPGGCLLGTDDITIVILPAIPAAQPLDLNVCGSSTGPNQFNINQTSLITSTLTNLVDYEIAYYDTNAGGEAFYGLPTGLIPDADLATYSISSTTATIYVRVHEISSDCVIVKSFNLNVIPAPSGSISYSASPYCDNVVAPQPITNTGLTLGGTYSATPAGLIIDATTGAITGFGSTVGTYTVKYDLAATADCPLYSTTTTVVIDHCTCTVTASSSLETVCVGIAIPSITYTSSTVATSGSVPAADLPPGVTGSFSGSTFTISGTPTTAGT
ncbi:choice-of-anchor L domain-containing protein, partial [Flavobacterium sp.]|uniref:choice-of-anchor L domain-containing protein n=1 Tax=Flavobacterium sp. TaxID=239 RepID=UPI0026247CC8